MTDNIRTNMLPQAPEEVETRERILAAAGAVFAESGFRDATIREICARAGANVAAVNYHFGDKGRLYAETFERARCFSEAEYDRHIAASHGQPADKRLELYIHAFVRKLLDSGRPTWHAKLMSREMIEPTGVLDEVVQNYVKPQFDMLCGIVGEILGPQATVDLVYMSAASVIGQCLHYHHSREVSTRLCPHLYNTPGVEGVIAAHVTAFSLHALTGLRDSHGDTP